MDLDTSNPAVQDFLALVRLQVLTPLSLLLNIATVVVCATITTPTIPHIAYIHPTAISPEFNFIAVYVLAVYVGQIGYCVLLVLASKPETKVTCCICLSSFYQSILILHPIAYPNKSSRFVSCIRQLHNGPLGYRMGPPMVPYHHNTPRPSSTPPSLLKHRLTCLPPPHFRSSIRHGTNPRPTPFLPPPPPSHTVPLLSLVRPSLSFPPSNSNPCSKQHNPSSRVPPSRTRQPASALLRMARLVRVRSGHVHQPPRAPCYHRPA